MFESDASLQRYHNNRIGRVESLFGEICIFIEARVCMLYVRQQVFFV